MAGDVFYSTTHEWARPESGRIVIGLSAFAAGEVGEVIHVQLPTVGRTVKRGESVAEIESVKSVNEFYSPVAGTITEVNSELAEHPELVNQDPGGKGWFYVVSPTPGATDGLLSDAQYQAHLRK